MSILWWILCDKDEVWLKVILPNFRENRFEVNHLGRRTRVITVGLIGSEASSGLSSSTTGCSLVLSSRHLNHSLVELVSEQSLRDWERDFGSNLIFRRWFDELVNIINNNYVFYSLTIILYLCIGDFLGTWNFNLLFFRFFERIINLLHINFSLCSIRI